MRWSEIVGEDAASGTISPIKPTKPTKPKSPSGGGVKPLTPAQSRTRAKKVTTANTKVADVAASNALRMQTATRQRNSI